VPTQPSRSSAGQRGLLWSTLALPPTFAIANSARPYRRACNCDCDCDCDEFLSIRSVAAASPVTTVRQCPLAFRPTHPPSLSTSPPPTRSCDFTILASTRLWIRDDRCLHPPDHYASGTCYSLSLFTLLGGDAGCVALGCQLPGDRPAARTPGVPVCCQHSSVNLFTNTYQPVQLCSAVESDSSYLHC
jgi:hypothetical protein